MLKIHPDKQTPGDKRALVRATEIFKVLNNSYDVYKKNEMNNSNAHARPKSSSKSGFPESGKPDSGAGRTYKSGAGSRSSGGGANAGAGAGSSNVFSRRR
jgi:hypothetical protein